ncbi:MAG TPA: response regulator transcription factor [Bacteroidia bacterium]|nr:response regulator transcription factor [Bacteroidia bacterium]
MENKKNIVLVDDHVVIRNGLKVLIEKLGPYTISHQFDNGQTLLDAIPLNPPAELIVMDINMPGMNGDEVMEQLNAKQVQVPVLVLSLNEDSNTVIKLFRLGVRGYLPKNCSADTMKKALDEVFRNGYFHNEFLTYSLRTNAGAGKKTEQERILEQLTAREKEFLKLVCHEKEYTYEQIADQMNVQHRTVDGYRESVFNKFDIKSKTGLVLFILRHKLFDHL